MTDANADGRLFDWYRTYIGEPDREVDVYLGFALFVGGIGLGAAAFAIAAAGQALGAEGFFFRKAAFATGMVALPATVASVVVLLPVGRRAVYGGALGALVCLGGVAFFWTVYPYNWATGTGPQYAVQVLFVYGVGLASLLAATGGALVAYHIDRARPHPGAIEGLDEDTGESYSDEDIERDIEEAMADVELSWGGVEKHEGTDLKITPDTEGMDLSGMNVAADRVHRSGVDEQVANLQGIKGGDPEAARSTATVDDQTTQLQELRRRQREEAAQTRVTVLDRLLSRVARLLGRD